MGIPPSHIRHHNSYEGIWFLRVLVVDNLYIVGRSDLDMGMKELRSRRVIALSLLIVLVVLFGISAYYYTNQRDAGVRTGIVGDSICGNLVDEESQDRCCSNAHIGEITVQCIGSWMYLSGTDSCQYVCDDALPSCPDDAQACPDEGVVERDPRNECEFSLCDERNE